jgi:hypothetical protein
VDQPAKPIAALHPAGNSDCHIDRLIRPTLPEALVRPRLVILLEELLNHPLNMLAAEDQQVIEALAPGCPTNRSANEFALGDRSDRRMTSTPSLLKTSSKTALTD